MERADRLTIAAGTPGFALMMSAGQAVAEAAMDLVEEGPIVVVAGRGNNGGDGFVAAAELAARGRDVSVILLCERDSLHGDAALAARGWKYPVLPFNPQAIGRPALIIDALFGAGLESSRQRRPARDDRGGQRQRRAGARGRPAERDQRHHGRSDGRRDRRRGDRDLLPPQAGASADAGPQALRPRARRRYRHRRARARRRSVRRRRRSCRDTWRNSFPVPVIDGHKYARGHAVVVSGELASTGAARLAARGALRAGAGLVTVASPRDALAVNAAALTAVMVRAIDTAVEFGEMIGDRRLNAVVIGPGAGVSAHTRDLVAHRAVGQARPRARRRRTDEFCRGARSAV